MDSVPASCSKDPELTSWRPFLLKELGRFDEACAAYDALFDAGYRSDEDIGDYVAIGYFEPFGSATFDNLGGTQGVAGVVVWEYWDGDSWEELSRHVGGGADMIDYEEVIIKLPTEALHSGPGTAPAVRFYYNTGAEQINHFSSGNRAIV